LEVRAGYLLKGDYMSIITDIEKIRERARQKINSGAVTCDYGLDKEKSIGILNEALATELLCVLRYRFHYFMASGLNSAAIADEFMEHAQEEQAHADLIAHRIKQLGGKPEMSPLAIDKNSHSEYKEGTSLVDMLKEDLIAERIAIESYREMIQWFGTKDPTTRRMLEGILAVEEEHADELADLLFATAPDTSKEQKGPFFEDEKSLLEKSSTEQTDEKFANLANDNKGKKASAKGNL
jgi:bacterioferritin